MSREICISSLSFGETKFLMHSVSNSWGEDDPLVEEIVHGKFDENETLKLWSYMVSVGQAGSLFVDVGSYAGIFSLLAARQNPAVKVVAFEASSVTYGRLVSNIILNGIETRVCATHTAAWNEKAHLDFPHRYGIYSMCPGESALLDKEVDHNESVFALPLDDLMLPAKDLPGPLGSLALGIAGFRTIDAIKIDVEGAERNVLVGAEKLIREHSPYIICELLTDSAVAKVLDVLDGYGYTIKQIGNERNYLLCTEEKRQKLDAGYARWVAGNSIDLSLSGRRVLQFTPSEI